jgi:beta-lactamase class A
MRREALAVTTSDHPEGLEGSGQSDPSRRPDPFAPPEELAAIDATSAIPDEPTIELRRITRVTHPLAIEEAERAELARKTPEPRGGVEEGAAPVANGAAKATPLPLPLPPGVTMEDIPTYHLPAAAIPAAPAPQPKVEDIPTHPLPPFPRYGPAVPAEPTVGAPLPDASGPKRKRGAIPRWAPFAALVALVALPALLITLLLPAINGLLGHLRQPDQLPPLTARLASATAITRLDPASAAFGGKTYPVAPAFASYYAANNGQAMLGQAITPPFASNLGETQFFMDGALVSAGDATADAIASGAPKGAGDLDPALARNGVDDHESGVIVLPLSQELLILGSAAPVGGADSGATYTALRSAAQADDFLTAPTPSRSDTVIRAPGAPEVIISGQRVFVIEGQRGGQKVGHSMPLALWTYINQRTIAPRGWATDIGAPLTEPLAMSATRNGARHHLLVQAFPQTVLILDLDQPDATGAPAIIPQPAGLDYLHTAGGPTVHASAKPQRWLTQDGALHASAGGAPVAIGLNTNSAVTLSGPAQWLTGDLWYAITWKTPTRNGSAWVDAVALTGTAPTTFAINGFDVLSPNLANYLAARGRNTGVIVYDVTRGVAYTYNSGGLFIMASSAKVPLMVSYLEHIESLNRGPNSYERSLLTAMIEHSDNNAAQVIYDTVGYDAGQRSHMRAWGITDYVGNPNGWGWAKWSPNDMGRLLSLLQTGKVLNDSDRALAFYLMSHIENDQQFGVGDSAPAGAQFWMKNGWVTGPDGAWNVNSSGIVKVGSETYIVSVYNGELGSYDQGLDIVNHVCGAVGQALK